MLITIGSITTATRAVKTIEAKTGIKGQVVHTPSEINRGGCSYSVRYSDDYENLLRRVIKENRIPAKSMVEGVSLCGSISSYPILINGVALPHSAQHSIAAAATMNVFVKSLFLDCCISFLL